jgi:hypothetical protein
MGVNDKEWKIWKMFNEPFIQKIRFEETQRNYIGEVKDHNLSNSQVNKKSVNPSNIELMP